MCEIFTPRTPLCGHKMVYPSWGFSFPYAPLKTPMEKLLKCQKLVSRTIQIVTYAHIHPQALAHTNNRHKVALIYTVGGGWWVL